MSGFESALVKLAAWRLGSTGHTVIIRDKIDKPAAPFRLVC